MERAPGLAIGLARALDLLCDPNLELAFGHDGSTKQVFTVCNIADDAQERLRLHVLGKVGGRAGEGSMQRLLAVVVASHQDDPGRDLFLSYLVRYLLAI